MASGDRMLNSGERAVMGAIYDKCGGSGNCLITVNEISLNLPKKRKMANDAIEATVRSLELDDYFDVIFSDRHGEQVLCINLHSKGLSFKREAVQLKRAVFTRLLLAGISACATFIVGKILFFFFH